MKGQAMLMDFAIAFMLFVLAWALVSGEFDETAREARSENSFETMRLMADYALEGLVKGGGLPDDWENRPISDLNFTGLASRDREISPQKLTAFSNLSGAYEQLRQKTGLSEFDFFFQFDGIDDANAGLPPQGSATKVVARRIVNYKGGAAVATLTLYRLD